jgi:CO/xanthine dehydrogenase Mo-binding subunit
MEDAAAARLLSLMSSHERKFEMTLTTGIPRLQRLFRVFHQVRVLRINEMPQIDIVLIESSEKPGGMGEPAVALIGPAAADALFDATGKRVRRMPLSPGTLRAPE